ncbi:unnamed protein product [Lactuca saligna]|uniref:RING-type E3 ubiquitin transferase n=1 Tax=Lactuca saligna TaxID=75948 RepID=A0AA35YY35_LACSI|nr:unnamed protein product [Lactuca saligna]
MINKLISFVCSYFLPQTAHPAGSSGTHGLGVEDKSCCVCLLRLEKARDEERRVLACGHEFHKVCVDKWFDECRKTCPVCRFSFEDEEMKTRKSQELTAEMAIWFSSFHVAGYI